MKKVYVYGWGVLDHNDNWLVEGEAYGYNIKNVDEMVKRWIKQFGVSGRVKVIGMWDFAGVDKKDYIVNETPQLYNITEPE